MLAVTDLHLRQIWPGAREVADEINQVTTIAGIALHTELAHFVAQTIFETAGYRRWAEPSWVARAYEGRADLGNTQQGDGVRFRGRGAIHLTGRDNYRRFGAWVVGHPLPGVVGVNPVDHPDFLLTPPYRFLAAAYYWSMTPGLAQAAREDDVVVVTRLIQGGTGGLAERTRLTARSLKVFAGAHEAAAMEGGT